MASKTLAQNNANGVVCQLLNLVAGPAVNTHPAERVISGLSGGAMLLRGLRQGGWKGWGLALVGGGLVYRAATGHCQVYEKAGFNTNPRSARSETRGVEAEQGITVEQEITIDRPASEVYAFWRDLENLPRFMNHLESVQVSGDNEHSYWVAKAPAGQLVAWAAEITDDIPNKRIAWRSLANADVPNEGAVTFTDKGNSTKVKVNLRYDPPAGKLGAFVAKLFGEEPNQQISDDLQRLKEILEDNTAAPQSQNEGRQQAIA